MFPMFFRAGGWIALAGMYRSVGPPTWTLPDHHFQPATHFHFIHEIPMFKSYEIRTNLAAWDQKWVRSDPHQTSIHH